MPDRHPPRYKIRRIWVGDGPDQGPASVPVDPPLASYEVELDTSDLDVTLRSPSPDTQRTNTKKMDESILAALLAECMETA